MTDPDRRECEDTLELLDAYATGELPEADMDRVARHLKECPACAKAMSEIAALRLRVRQAARAVPVPNNLGAKLIANVRRERMQLYRTPSVMAIAAAALLTIALVAYQLRHPQTDPSGTDDTAAIVSGSAPTVRVGLGDHIHCAVLRKYPSQPASFAEMAEALGPGYADLLPAMQRQTPAGMRVEMAHKCVYAGREYVHLVARDGRRLISLIVTRRQGAEAFEHDLRTVAGEDGNALYAAHVRQFSLAALETPAHLVYLISDADDSGAVRMLQAMSHDVRAVLAKRES